MRPLVAVTQRVVETASYHEPRDALSHDWARYLVSLGVDLLPVPNRIDDPARLVRRAGCRALLLSNGNDVGEWVGAVVPEPDDAAPATWRDRTEYRLLDHAVTEGLPVLGVCRGMHLINRYFGGRTCRSLRAAGFAEHVRRDHEVRFGDAAWQQRAGVDTHVVNSYHNQGVRAEDLAVGLRATAVADDDLVEAIEHDDHLIRGIQWHPERPPNDDPINERIVRWGLNL